MKMTIYDLSIDERLAVTKKIENIIGKRKDAITDKMSRNERMIANKNYDALFDKLAKIWVKYGDKALSLQYTDCGSYKEGTTPNGKWWTFEMNTYGWTERTHHCGTLRIEDEGCIFTSGTLARAFEYILTH